MNSKFFTGGFFTLLLGALLVSPPITAAEHLAENHPYRRKGMVWEPAVRISPDLEIPGFFRPKERRGYRWIEGEWDEAARWHPGYWKPLNEYRRKGGVMKWVGGYWSGKRWVGGYWRIPEKKGHIWVEGYFDPGGRWRAGRWKKVGPS